MAVWLRSSAVLRVVCLGGRFGFLWRRWAVRVVGRFKVGFWPHGLGYSDRLGPRSVAIGRSVRLPHAFASCAVALSWFCLASAGRARRKPQTSSRRCFAGPFRWAWAAAFVQALGRVFFSLPCGVFCGAIRYRCSAVNGASETRLERWRLLKPSGAAFFRCFAKRPVAHVAVGLG